MQDQISVRWHSRAGQGAVTAAGFLAESMAQFGYRVQHFPDFGAEKRGAPVVVFNRLSKTQEVLDDPAHLQRVDLVVLLDPTLVGNEIDYEDVLRGLHEDGTLVINTSKTDPSGFHKRFKGSIYYLNATQIAMETINRNIPNVAMMGGLTKVLEANEEKMRSILAEHLGHYFPPKLVESNLVGFEKGYKEIAPVP